MDILLFDMDGVLLKPLGYHRALKETVRLAGISSGYGEVQLADEQIAQFEALGISSEWHSSALSMAVMVLAKHKGQDRGNGNSRSFRLDLEELFEALAARPVGGMVIEHGVAAIEELATRANVPASLVRRLVTHSESIQHSATLNWFQELILGSALYERIYHKEGQLQTESYLELYDERLLSQPLAEGIIGWVAKPGHGAGIMTNRPSSGPPGFEIGPDAGIGAGLVGLDVLPVIGLGESSWLAAQTGREVRQVTKPAREHALVAILAASGWPLEQSLQFVGRGPTGWKASALQHLQESKITVFEDTPGGIISVQVAGETLNELGLRVEVRKIGIAEDGAKRSALAAQCAVVYPEINQALASLNDF